MRRPLNRGRRRPGVGQRRSIEGVTFAEAAAEYLRFSEEDRGCKPSTVRNYRNAIRVHLLPVFGEMALEDITVQEIEQWRAGMSSARQQRELSNKTKNNLLVLMHAIFRRAVKLYGLPANPVASVDRFRVRSSGDIQVFSPEEVWALVRAARSEADAAIFLTAAFTGLRRGELLGLRWRDVDFTGSTIRVRASYAAGKLTTPKSGKVRAVPMAPDVASALAQARRPGAVHGRRRLRLRRRGWPPPRRRRAQQPIPRRAGAGGTTTLEVPRSQAHLWHADDRQGRHPAGAGVDGARRHPDDDEVPALRAARGRCRARRRGVRSLDTGQVLTERYVAPESARPGAGSRSPNSPRLQLFGERARRSVWSVPWHSAGAAPGLAAPLVRTALGRTRELLRDRHSDRDSCGAAGDRVRGVALVRRRHVA